MMIGWKGYDMHRRILGGVMAISLPLLPAQQATAAEKIWCTGTLSNALTDINGSVMVLSSYRNGWTQICNLNEEWKNVPVQTCWAWFSKVNTAVAEGKSVVVHYLESANTTCSTIPTYSAAPAPYYVMLQST